MSNEIYHRVGQTADPASNVVPKLFSKMLLTNMYNDMGIWKHLLSFTADVKAGGESIRVPELPHTAATTVNFQTGAYTDQVITPSAETIEINKWVVAPHSIVDSVVWQNNVSLESALAVDGAKAVREHIDEQVCAIAGDATITNEIGSVSAALDEKSATKAFEKLMVARLRPDMNPNEFVFVLPSGCLHQMKGNAYFAAAQYLGTGLGGNAASINVPRLHGIPTYFVYSSNLVDSGDSQFGMLCHRTAIGIAIQSEPRYQKLGYKDGTLAMQYATDMLYGIKLLRPEYACRLLVNVAA